MFDQLRLTIGKRQQAGSDSLVETPRLRHSFSRARALARGILGNTPYSNHNWARATRSGTRAA
ncbi:MAG: hypothetical protein ACPG4T_05580, partial [Nannocystaceae bacterium]